VLGYLNNFVRIVRKYCEKSPFSASLFIPSMVVVTKQRTAFDCIVASVFVLAELQADSTEYLKVVFDSPLFDPRVNLFCSKPGDDCIHQARSLVYEYLLFKSWRAIRLYFAMKGEFPLMVAEFFYRGALNFAQIPKSVLTDNLFLYFLFTAIMSGQLLNFRFSSNNLSEATFMQWFDVLRSGQLGSYEVDIVDECQQIECGRMCLLLFISRAFEVNEVGAVWNVSAHFAPAFFSLVLEKSLRPIISGMFAKVWIRPGIPLDVIASGCLQAIFGKYEGLSDVLICVLDILNPVLEARPDQSHCFTSLVRNVIDFLVRADPFPNLLHCSLRFCVIVSMDIDSRECSAILAGIRKNEGDEPSATTFADLVDLMTSKHKIIRRPAVCSLFVQAFAGSSKFDDAISLLLSLCHRSRSNIVKFHEEKLDFCILDLIGENKISCGIDVLSLVQQIGAVASSMAVVHRFVQLMCPIRSHYLPDNIVEFIRTISSICASSRGIPYVYLPVAVDAPWIHVSKLPTWLLARGFLFSITAFCEETGNDFKASILRIQDKSGRRQLDVAFSNMRL
jgi:hypothetical protein